MDGEKTWKVVERTSIVLGALGGVVGGVFAVLTYIRPEAPSASPAKVAVAAKAVTAAAAPHGMALWLYIGISALLLLTGWAMMAMRLRVQKPKQVHVRHEPLAEAMPPPPPSSAPPTEPHDVTEARLALANFALQRIGPAVDNLGRLMSLASALVGTVNQSNPIALFASNHVIAATPRRNSLSIFDNLDAIRTATLEELEKAVWDTIASYAGGASMIADVLYACRKNRDKFTPEFRSKCNAWIVEHISLQNDLKRMSQDIHYPYIRRNFVHPALIQDRRQQILNGFSSFCMGIFVIGDTNPLHEA